MNREPDSEPPQTPRSDRRIITAAVIGMILVMAAQWFISDARNDRAISAERGKVVAEREARLQAEEKVQALEGLTAAEAALKDQCQKGIKSACHQLVGLETMPDPTTDDGERQDAEVQEAEIQEPEIQEGERDDPERQDPELNDPDTNDPELQDPDSDDPEQQDPESDDPEVDDPDANDPDADDPEKQDDEIQDPERDDPDPNSLLGFVAVDNCSPPAGEVIVDVDITVLRDPDASTVTYVLTCTSVPIASLINPPGPSR